MAKTPTAPTERAMLMTTTDTLPQPFTPLGMVTAYGFAGTGAFALKQGAYNAMHAATGDLQDAAAAMHADAIIAVRVSATSGMLIVTGTAVKLS